MNAIRILSLLFALTVTVRSDEFHFEGSGTDDIGLTKNFPSDDEDITEGSGNEGIDFGDTRGVGIDVIPDGKSKTIDSQPDYEEPVEEKSLDEETEDEVQEPEEKVATGSLVTTTHFLAAVITGGVIGLLVAVCVIMIVVYRMRKKDEGSYAIDYAADSKKPHGNYEYTKGVDSKEYYA